MSVRRFTDLWDHPVETNHPAPAAFVFCPLVLSLGAWQQNIYEQALAQARAVVQPSWLERDVLGHWN